MGDLLGRHAAVTIGAPPGTGFRVDSGTPPARGFRIAFDVAKSLKSSLNQGTVLVWNLSEASRHRIREDRAQFLLEAGYGGELSTLLRGQVSRAVTERQGPDLVTTIECLDGLDAVQEAEVKVTLPRGVRVGEVIRHALVAIAIRGVTLGDVDTAIAAIESAALAARRQVTTRRPRAINERAADLLDSLGRTYRFDWAIQDAVLEVHPWDALVGGETVDLTAESGLLGTPSPLVASATRDGAVEARDGVRFRSLLRPRIRPGVVVRLEAGEVSGRYRIHEAAYRGDTVSGAFEVQAEGYVLAGAA